MRISSFVGATAIVLLLPALSGQASFAATEAPAPARSDTRKAPSAGVIDLRTQIIQLRNAIQQRPKDPRLNLELARRLLDLGEYGQAEAQARAAADKGGNDDEIAPVFARAMFEGRKFAIMVQVVAPGSRPPVAEAQVRALLARAHLALGEFDFAEPLIEQAKKLDPNGLAVTMAIAQLQLSRKDIAGADATLAHARALAPNDHDVLRLVAQIALLNGDKDRALEACDAILAKWPYDVSGLVMRASARIDESRFDAAREDVDTLLDVDPDLLVARYLDALIFARQGDLAEADERLNLVASDLGALPEGYYLRALIETKRGRLEGAMAAARSFVSYRPDDGRGNRLLAIIALRQNDTMRAIEALQPVVASQSEDGLAATLLARAYAMQQDDDKAFQYYDHAGDVVAARLVTQIGGTADALESGVEITLNSVDEMARSALDENTLALVSLISDLKFGSMSRASTLGEALIQRKPDDAVAKDWLGIVRMRQQRYDDAVAMFDEAIQQSPKFLDPRRNRARALTAAGRWDDAQKAWQDVLGQAANDEQALLGQAEVSLRRGDIAKGAEGLEIAQRYAGYNPTAGIAAVNLYASLKDWGHAVPLARAMSSFFARDAKVLNVVTQVIADAGNRDEAAKLYRTFLQGSPSSAEALAGEAQFVAADGDKKTARRLLAQAVAAAPADFNYMKALVDFDDANKGEDEALKTARSFAGKQPAAAGLLGADILIKYNRVADAIAELQAALKRQPDSQATILLAQLQSAHGEAAAAEAMIQSWLKDHPQDWQALIQLGNLYMARHADDDAVATYLKVAVALPRNAVILNNLAWLGARKSDSRALDWAERAYYLAPSGQTSDTFGWALARGGHAEAGLPLLASALASTPDDAAVQYHLAFALEASGQKDAARTLLEQALNSQAPFNERSDAAQLLATLQKNEPAKLLEGGKR